MSELTNIVIALCYATLLIELTVLHTPSVASSRNIWVSGNGDLRYFSDRYRRLFKLTRAQKLLRFFGPLLVIYAAFLYPLFEIWRGPDSLGDYVYQPSKIATTLGAVVLVSGRLITLSSVFALRASAAIEDANPQTRFVFRWSRNPGLVGMYLMFAGLWISLPSLLFLLGVLVYVAHMHFKVRLEEDFLSNKYGHSFTAYRNKTPRYLL